MTAEMTNVSTAGTMLLDSVIEIPPGVASLSWVACSARAWSLGLFSVTN
jgi:hypothetical protein